MCGYGTVECAVSGERNIEGAHRVCDDTHACICLSIYHRQRMGHTYMHILILSFTMLVFCRVV